MSPLNKIRKAVIPFDSAKTFTYPRPTVRAAVGEDMVFDGCDPTIQVRKGTTGDVSHANNSLVFLFDDLGSPITAIGINEKNAHKFHIPSLGLYR